MAVTATQRAAARLAAAGLALSLLASGCDQDLGAITLYGPGEAQIRFQLDSAATVSFVTNLEVEGPQDLETAASDFRYDIEARQGGRKVATAQCDPLRIGSSWSRSARESSTRIGSYRHSIAEGQVVGCAVTLEAAGTTTLRIRLVQERKSAVHLILVELAARR